MASWKNIKEAFGSGELQKANGLLQNGLDSITIEEGSIIDKIGGSNTLKHNSFMAPIANAVWSMAPMFAVTSGQWLVHLALVQGHMQVVC